MSNKFNIFLPDNPCRKGRTGRYTMQNGELIEGTLVVIFWFNEELLPYWFMVLEERYTTDLEDYHKVTNILKELAITNNMR